MQGRVPCLGPSPGPRPCRSSGLGRSFCRSPAGHSPSFGSLLQWRPLLGPVPSPLLHPAVLHASRVPPTDTGHRVLFVACVPQSRGPGPEPREVVRSPLCDQHPRARPPAHPAAGTEAPRAAVLTWVTQVHPEARGRWPCSWHWPAALGGQACVTWAVPASAHPPTWGGSGGSAALTQQHFLKSVPGGRTFACGV